MTINTKLKKTGDFFEIHNEKDSLSDAVELEKGKLYSGTLYIGQFLRDKAPDGYTVFVYTERQRLKEFREDDLEKVKASNLRLHPVPTASTKTSETDLQMRKEELAEIEKNIKFWRSEPKPDQGRIDEWVKRAFDLREAIARAERS